MQLQHLQKDAEYSKAHRHCMEFTATSTVTNNYWTQSKTEGYKAP